MGEAESATGNKKQRRKSALFGKWGVLILLSLAVFIIVIDTTIMNVAITALVHDLNTNIENEKFFRRYDTLLRTLSYNFLLHAKEEIVRGFRFG